MKKVLFLTMMLFTSNVFAEGYAGIYGATTRSNGNESTFIENQMIGVIGYRDSGLYGEAAVMKTGVGVSTGFYQLFDGLRINVGLIALNDKSTANVPGYGDRESQSIATGLVVGLDYEPFSIKYINYGADHTYNAVGKTGYDKKGKPVFGIVGSRSENINREMIWAGVTHKF